jgi:colanic acid/amylovoran biosynthesis protein
MKILLLNVHSPQNAGDLAILQQTIAYLEAAFPGHSLTATVNDRQRQGLPDGVTYVDSLTRWLVRDGSNGEWRWRKSSAPLYGAWLSTAALLYRFGRWRLLPRRHERRTVLTAYYDADLVAVIGGGHLYARHALNIAFIWLWLGIVLAVLMGKPVVMLPQSYGPLPGWLQRRLLRWLLDRCALVVSREYRSLEMLAEIGVRCQVPVLPDLAFSSAEANKEQVHEAIFPYLPLTTTPRPVVGMTLMDWSGQNPRFHGQQQYEAAIVALIRHIRERYDARVMLFAQCSGPTAAQDDRIISRRIIASAGPDPEIIFVDRPLSPELLKGAYRSLDLLVATRMHSAIFALSSGVPTLAIGYLHKSVGIMEMLGLTRHVVDIDSLSTEQLLSSFDSLWCERDEVRRHARSRVSAMQGTLAYLPALIRRCVLS